MQPDGELSLFYLNTLYEFADKISKQRSVEDILKGMLRIVIGAFVIKKGMVLVRHAGETTFELVTYQPKDLPAIESISQQLNADITVDLQEVDGLVELPPSPLSPVALLSPQRDDATGDNNATTPSTLSELIANAGMRTIIVFQVQERLTVCVGLGEPLSDTPISSHQSELLKALRTHTEIALGNALFLQDTLRENQQLKEALHKQYRFDNIVGKSAKMQEIYQRIQQVAKYPNYSVLIYGETGTGKELIARAIHEHSPRRDKRFLAINCAALPVDLVESELFGHEKGAFTGADKAKSGLFEEASGGAIFLDEIAEIPPGTQVKLLRALAEKEIIRVGGSDVRTVDVRIIAATNMDLTKAIANGQLREDLFHRFPVKIPIPPLRERKEDIPLLVRAFLEEIAKDNQQPAKMISPEGLKVLMDYSWPGNVRDLKNVLMEAVMVTEDNIILPKNIRLFQDEAQTVAQTGLSLKDSVERLKRTMIEKALDDCNGNKTKAAVQLGMTRQNLQNMMRRLKKIENET